jgi:hypothetical protein
MNKVYLAGPITSLSYDETNSWRVWFKREITKSGRVKCLSPMRGKFNICEDKKEDYYDNE